ncbi:MAG: hypothetical protein ACI93R_000891 [Flavobacteriales bacterium]|jgi:hypothetical protein
MLFRRSCLFLMLLTLCSANIFAAPPLPDSFDSAPFEILNFDQHCKSMFGSEAFYDETGPHVYDGGCSVNDTQRTISVADICMTQYSLDHEPVLMGNAAGDWACTDWVDTEHKVIPLILVASDLIFDVAEVDGGINNSARVLENVRTWYADHMASGSTFSAVSPVIKFSSKTAQEWVDLSCMTGAISERDASCDPSLPETTDEDRFIYFFAAKDEAVALLADAPTTLNAYVSVFVFTGTDFDTTFLGAAAQGPSTGKAYNVQAPQVAACDENLVECGLFPVAHELGHNIGLAHSGEAFPNDPDKFKSVKQNPFWPDALILEGEQTIIDASPFFSVEGNGDPVHQEAELFDSMSGIQTEGTTDINGGLNVGWTDAGDWLSYTVVAPESATGEYEISYRVASNVFGSAFRLENESGSIVYDFVQVPNTSGWQNWTTLTTTVSLPTDGAQVLRVVVASGGWNLNWFEVHAANEPCTSCPPFETIQIEAEDYASSNGVQLENTSDQNGGQNVGWIDANDWMFYLPIDIPTTGDYLIEYRVASMTGTGTLQLEESAASLNYGSLAIPNTGSWQGWTTIQHTVQLDAGSHEFTINALSGGWNINWFRISSVVN